MEESTKRRNRHRNEVHEINDFGSLILELTFLYNVFLLTSGTEGLGQVIERWYVVSAGIEPASDTFIYTSQELFFKIKSLSESKQNLISYKIRTIGCICTRLFNMYTLYRCQNSSLKITKLVWKFLNPFFKKKRR